MSFEFLINQQAGPAWKGSLPGRPEAFFLKRGAGEHAMLGIDLFTVLLSGDETEGQFGVFTSKAPKGEKIITHVHAATHETFYVIEGKVRVFVQAPDGTRKSQLLEPGDFGFVPAGLVHTYQVEESALLMGVATGGFERFFQQIGQPTDHCTTDQPPGIPQFPAALAVAASHQTKLMPEFDWPEVHG